MNVRKIKAGEIVIRDGEPGGEMFVVRSGKVRVYKTVNMEKIELAVFEKGSFFGEMSILLSETRHATVEALEDGELLVLDKAGLISNMQSDPSFGFVMMKNLALRLTEAHKVISKLQGEKSSLQMMYARKA